MIRVYVSSESPIMRAGLESLIGSQSGLALSAQADDADVVVADGVHEPVELGDHPTVALAEANAPELIRQGYGAVLPRDTGANELAAAIRGAAAGLVVLDRTTLSALMGAERVAPVGAVETLTPRELEVVRLLADGLGNKEIAGRLFISEHTVKFHVAAILQKLNASSRAEAVAIGMRSGLILL